MKNQVNGKTSSFITNKLLPVIMKFVNTKAVKALQDGMVYALPFIIIGSIFLILSNVPVPAIATALKNSGWSAFFTQAYTTTFGILSIWAAVGIAYVYVRNEGYEALPAALTSLSAFLMLQMLQVTAPLAGVMGKNGSGIANSAGNVVLSGNEISNHIDKLPGALQSFLESPVTGVINISWLSGQGMVAAIIVGIVVGWAYGRL